MHVGILTAPLRAKPLSEIIPWAASIGAKALEVEVRPGSHHNVVASDERQIAALQALLDEYGLRISSLAAYAAPVGVSESQAADAKDGLLSAIRLARQLGVDTVCTIAGFANPGKTKAQTIAQDLPGALRPALDLAGEYGIRIALENWYATNIQHLDHWRATFEAIPDAHFGLNFDPSHLDWQGIDVTGALREFRERIFHVHAKDVALDRTKLARVGYQGDGWWRYTLPGYGHIRWGEFITQLKLAGYDGVLSIEHEDDAFGAEDGFAKAARYLNALV